jgi:hypothetical protein
VDLVSSPATLAAIVAALRVTRSTVNASAFAALFCYSKPEHHFVAIHKNPTQPPEANNLHVASTRSTPA